MRGLVRFPKALAGLAALAAFSFAATAQEQPQPAAEEAAPPMSKGEYLARAGNCISCHTREGGEPFAGGVSFTTDFGTIYSTNITPDAEAGIGKWTKEQFRKAMHEGVRPDGAHLYPAFPYPAFTKVSEEDVDAIFDFMKTVAPSKFAPPANDMPFPFNQRALMGVWNKLFVKNERFQPDPKQSAEYNRGAYLVEGLGHCGACHTPRNMLGAEKNDEALSGGTYLDKIPTGDIRPWHAVNLTTAEAGLKHWTAEDITTYLKTGHGTRVGSYGPMNEVIANSTSKLSDADISAMATYIKALPVRGESQPQTLSAELKREGETLYTIHCGTCHLPTGIGSTPGAGLGASLVGSAVVQARDPSSMINVILYGTQVIQPAPAKGWKNMKAFGETLYDDQVAAIASYVRTNWGNRGGRVTAEQVAKQR